MQVTVNVRSPEINKQDVGVSQFEQLSAFVFLNMVAAEEAFLMPGGETQS